MHYSNIKYNDVANGEGVRTSLFVSGCRNHCKGCFNPETWDFENGNYFDLRDIEDIIDSLRPDYIAGLSILGGDPFEPENVWQVATLIQMVKQEYGNKKTIWIWTGYIYENLMKRIRVTGDISDSIAVATILRDADVLVDGPFIEEQKDISLQFRGSRNQRIIDLSTGKEWRDSNARLRVPK